MRQLLGLDLRGGEDYSFCAGRLREHLAHDAELLALVTYVSALPYRLVGFRHGDAHLGRIVQDRSGQFAYLRRQRGREHYRLTLAGQVGNDLHYVVAESHIEHPVRLVENEALHMRQVHPAVGQVRNESSGGGYDHIGAHQHTALLNLPTLAVASAVDHRGRYGKKVRKALELHIDLLGQLARRHYDKRLDHIVGIALYRQAVQQRQSVGRRLARAGLRAADNVAAGKYDRDCMFLNRRHIHEVHRIESFEYFRFEFKFVESHLFLLFCR